MLNFLPDLLAILSCLEIVSRSRSRSRSRVDLLLGLCAAALANREPSAAAAPGSKVASVSLSRSRSAPAASGLEALSVPTALSVLPTPQSAETRPLWQRPARRVAYVGLGALLPAGPSWQNLEANSEQRQPLHLGATPHDQVFSGQATAQPRLPLPLKQLAESQLPRLRRRLGAAQAEFEAWPTQNDVGRLTWVVGRWRPRGDVPWRWLEKGLHSGPSVDPDRAKEPQLILPERLEPAKAADQAVLLDDFLLGPSLYEKPQFSNCIWTTADGESVLAAFLPSRDLPPQRELLRAASQTQLGGLRCLAMPQPARFHEHALTLSLIHI